MNKMLCKQNVTELVKNKFCVFVVAQDVIMFYYIAVHTEIV